MNFDGRGIGGVTAGASARCGAPVDQQMQAGNGLNKLSRMAALAEALEDQIRQAATRVGAVLEHLNRLAGSQPEPPQPTDRLTGGEVIGSMGRDAPPLVRLEAASRDLSIVLAGLHKAVARLGEL